MSRTCWQRSGACLVHSAAGATQDSAAHPGPAARAPHAGRGTVLPVFFRRRRGECEPARAPVPAWLLGCGSRAWQSGRPSPACGSPSAPSPAAPPRAARGPPPPCSCSRIRRLRHHRLGRSMAGQTRHAQCLAVCVKYLSVVRRVRSTYEPNMASCGIEPQARQPRRHAEAPVTMRWRQPGRSLAAGPFALVVEGIVPFKLAHAPLLPAGDELQQRLGEGSLLRALAADLNRSIARMVAMCDSLCVRAAPKITDTLGQMARSAASAPSALSAPLPVWRSMGPTPCMWQGAS
jgi:hypothetical protein